MEIKKEGKRKYFLPITLGVLVIAIAMAIFIPTIVKNNKRQAILESGEEGVGYNLEMQTASFTLGSESTCYLTFKYYDGKEEKSGETSVSYTQSECAAIVFEGSLDIIFNEDGAVQSTFDIDLENKTPTTSLIILYIVGIALALVGVAGIFKGNSRPVDIDRYGVECYGVVESVSDKIFENGEELYSVKVSYETERGEAVVGNTGYNYTLSQTEKFPVGKRIKIKYHGKNVKILNG